MKPHVNIFWFRPVFLVLIMLGFIIYKKKEIRAFPFLFLNKNILDELEDKTDRRVEFIHLALKDIQRQLVKIGASLDVRYGTSIGIFLKNC